MQAIEDLLNFHVYFVDVLHSGADFARAWVVPKLARMDLFTVEPRLGFHRIFHVGKLFHEVVILLTVIAKPRHVLFLLPCGFLAFLPFRITDTEIVI